MENLSAPAVFKAIEAEVPEDFGLLPYVEPWADANGNVTALTAKYSEEETSEGITWHTEWFLTDFSPNGEILNSAEIPVQMEQVFTGAVTDTAVYLAESMTGCTRIVRYDRETKELTSTGDGSDFFGRGDYALQALSTDENGFLYCTDTESLIVLNPDLSLAFSLDFPHPVRTMAKGADGAVWAAYRDGQGTYALKIDPEKQMLYTPLAFMKGRTPEFFSLIPAVNASGSRDEGKISFYYSDDEMIWGVADNSGDPVEFETVDLMASGISRFRDKNSLGFGDPEGLYPSVIINGEVLFAARFSDNRHSVPILYVKAEGMNPEDGDVILLAHSVKLTSKMVSLIKDWNSAHPQARIEVLDYSVYTSDDDRFGGEAQICFDILNAGLKPDIIVTDPPAYRKSDRSVMTFVNARNLYVDLTPYLEIDETVNFDHLYGLVPRSFDDGRGGIWGITTGFTLNTVLANPDYLSAEIIEKGSWTVSEWLDVYESLPPDVEMYHQQVRAWGVWNYLRDGYAAFMADGRCAFDSPEFIRYLKLMKNVSADYETWKRTSLYSDLVEEIHYRTGKLAVMKYSWTGLNYRSYHSLLDLWNLEKEGAGIHIGFARDSGIGDRMTPSNILIITKYARDPDLCFEAVKSFFSLKYTDPSGGVDPWFSLKPLEEEAAEAAEGIPLPELLGEANYERMNRLFDEGGQPLLEYVPEAVWEIIDEETSAYYAGVGTAEDCARKIQSRASLWEEEHK